MPTMHQKLFINLIKENLSRALLRGLSGLLLKCTLFTASLDIVCAETFEKHNQESVAATVLETWSIPVLYNLL